NDPNGDSMTNIVLSSSTLIPGSGSGGAPNSLSIIIQTTGSPMTVVWDGTNDSGSFVTDGHYELGIHWDSGQGSTADITRGVLVAGVVPRGTVWAQPNELIAAKGGNATTFMANVPTGQTVDAEIYTVAGGVIWKGRGQAGSQQVSWNAGGAASGIYIANIKVLDGARRGPSAFQRGPKMSG